MNEFDELKERLPEVYKKRLEHELDVITNNGIQNFMPYFLTLQDIVKYAKNKGIVVGPARGCLLPNVRVFVLNKGFVDIKNVEKDDIVISHTGKKQIVKNTFVYNCDEELIQINIFNRSFSPLQLTVDHKVMVKRNKEKQWIEAGKIKIDDFLYIPKIEYTKKNKEEYFLKEIIKKRTDIFENERYLYQCVSLEKSKYGINNFSKKTKIKRNILRNFLSNPEKVSLKTLYCLNVIAKNLKLNGLYELRDKMWSDGKVTEYVNKKIKVNQDFCFLMGVLNARGQLIAGTREKVQIGDLWEKNELRIPELIKKIFNHSVIIKNNKEKSSYYCISSIFADFFVYFFNNNSIETQRIGNFVSSLNEENSKAFLSGLIFGLTYGSLENREIIVYNESFALDIRYLLWKLGISNRLEKNILKNGISYKIILYYNDHFSFEIENDGIWLRIESITRFSKKTKVYDLEVKTDSSFLTENGIVHNSAGGCLTAYLLGITSTDPIKYDLPFSRFLSKSRLKKSVPDIDVDFEVIKNNPMLHRDEVNKYIFEKYGEKAAQIATFGMLKLKNSLQDSFRINISQPTEAKIHHLIKSGKKDEANSLMLWLKNERTKFDSIRKTLGVAPAGISELEWLTGVNNEEHEYAGLLKENIEFKKWAEENEIIINTAKLLLGIPRNIGKHAAGVVIADRPIHEMCGVMKIDGHNVIAYNKKDVSKLGLIKNDNLASTCLSFIGDTLRSLKSKGIFLDPWDLPEDPDVFDSFMDGYCLTIFQHETSGGANFVKKLKPKCKEDLFFSVALNRPGGIDAKISFPDGTQLSASEVYIQRRNGNIPVTYLHDDLIPILKNTLGVYVFQEQVMASLQLLLGYTEEESDSIRSAISDKNPQAFEEVKSKLPSLLNKGWNISQINEFYNQIIAFSGYAFNKSHSCGYGLMAYATAYLKYHYKIEWWAAVLSNSSSDEVMKKYWREINSFVNLPSVNKSKPGYTIAEGKLIPPLNLIKGIGDKALQEISDNAPFLNIEDFVNRAKVNKTVVINLLKAGAMNDFFEKNISLSEKIKIFFELKGKKEKKKISIDPEYLSIDSLKEYLLAKSVLPIANISLSSIIFNTDFINKPFINVVYYTSDLKEVNLNSLRGTLPLISGKSLNTIIENFSSFNENFLNVCCYGYVTELRKFPYFCKNTQTQKQAMELKLDFDNFFFNIVCWPNKKEISPVIEKFVLENHVFLFKLKIQKERTNFSITGIEEITYKKIHSNL